MTLLHNKPDIYYLDLSSNMISGEGFETCLEELIANSSLTHLDLGVTEASIRKNALGMQGAVCISSLLMRNQTIEYLSVKDNDFGPDGGQCIGLALAGNTTLKTLKTAENHLTSTGAIPIIQNASSLISLDLARNELESNVGKSIC